LNRGGLPREANSQTLINRFETACIPSIPLVAEFGPDHIEKAVFVTSADRFRIPRELFGGMTLKFGEEIEKLKSHLSRSVAIQVKFSVFLR